MPPDLDDLHRTLAADGPAAALDRLISSLRASGDYGPLFYALLMKKRHELGVSPVPTGPARELPEAVHAEYEEAIRQAGRTVGKLFLDAGDIPRAWSYFRMLGEPEPVAAALDAFRPAEEADCQAEVEIALHQGVNPRRGFDLVLDRQGICSAISLFGGFEAALAPDVRAYCAGRLVRSLHEQLLERVRADVAARDRKEPPATATLPELIAGRDELFGEDSYHVDVSHLGAVVQMSVHLPPGEELKLARELCDYGRRLASGFRYPGVPPFEDIYLDYGVFLAVLAGENVEEGLAHFRAKAEAMDPDRGTYPAEVLVNLLLQAGRPAEALAAARRYLAGADDRQLTCPGVFELSRQAGDYRAMADVARERGDAVHFLAGLLAQHTGEERPDLDKAPVLSPEGA
jgi:hypothetical protein